MKVLYKNGAPGVDYALDGARLSFRGGELTLDLEKLQRDYPVTLVVSEDREGRLTLGPAWRYVAEIEIPARRSAVRKTGAADDFGFPVLERVYFPLDTAEVTLTLWKAKEGDNGAV